MFKDHSTLSVDPTVEEDDADPEDFVQEEHHSWFENATAVKFLLAGGIAGGGEHTEIAIYLFTEAQIHASITNMHSTL